MDVETDLQRRRRLLHMGLVVLIFAVALGYRLWLLADSGDIDNGVMIHGVPYSDARGWDVYAAKFAEGSLGDRPWGWNARRPFWWMFLGSVYALTGQHLIVGQLVNVLLSACAVVIAFDLLRRLAPLPVALAMTAAVCFQATDGLYAVTTMSEPLGSFLTVLGAWVCAVGCERMSSRPWRWRDGLVMAAGGFCLALSNLARPLNLPVLAAMPIVFFSVARARSPRRFSAAARMGVMFLLGAMLALGPWLIRQYVVHGIVAISDNSAVALAAATNPEYGRWTGDFPGKPGKTIGEAYRAYAADARENLRQHLDFYLGNVWLNLQLGVKRVSVPVWSLLSLLALSLISSVKRRVSRARLARIVFVHGALAVACWNLSPEGADLFWLGAAVLALVCGHRLGVLSALLLASLLSLGLACLVMSRFTYSLNWMASGLASWLLWGLTQRLSGVAHHESAWREPSPVQLGFVGRWARISGAGALLVLLVGMGRATALTLSSDTAWRNRLLASQQARPWIEVALTGEAGAVYEPFRSYLQVARSRPRSGYERVFGPGEGYPRYSPPFTPRPYTFSMFDLRPDVASNVRWGYMPGTANAWIHRALPAEQCATMPKGADWLWVGLVVQRESSREFEVVAFIEPGDPPQLVQPSEKDALLHFEDLQGKPLLSGRSGRILGRTFRPGEFQLIPDPSSSRGVTGAPVLFTGDRIRSPVPTSHAVLFAPATGATRSVVNPAEPAIEGSDLVFTTPGEYYLTLGDGESCKTCVLSPQEEWSQSVVRIFNFCVANVMEVGGKVPEFGDRWRFFDAWFRRKGPVPLSSADAGHAFADLVTKALNLPVRFVNLTGVTRKNGTLQRNSRYLPEVYLPDKGCFVLFDVCHGWYAPWLDAAGCARAIARLAGDAGDLSVDALFESGLVPGSETPEPKRLKTDRTFDELADGVQKDWLSEGSGRDWASYGPLFAGGVGYYGARRGRALGTGFIEESYVFGSLHEDKSLEAEVARWLGSYYDDVTIVPLDELEQRLRTGHGPLLREAPWETWKRW